MVMDGLVLYYNKIEFNIILKDAKNIFLFIDYLIKNVIIIRLIKKIMMHLRSNSNFIEIVFYEWHFK